MKTILTKLVCAIAGHHPNVGVAVDFGPCPNDACGTLSTVTTRNLECTRCGSDACSGPGLDIRHMIVTEDDGEGQTEVFVYASPDNPEQCRCPEHADQH